MSQDFDRPRVEQMIKTIMDWSYENEDSFDTEFVESLSEQLERWGKLSEKQVESLENIMESWKIEMPSTIGNPKVRDILSRKK